MSLLAWYPLSKNTINYGLDGTDLTVAGGIGLNGQSNFGGGLNCTGDASKYLHRPGFNLTKDFTWCCWFKINEKGANVYQFILSEGRDTTGGMNILTDNSNRLKVILGSSNTIILDAITYGKWYHIAVTVEESGCNAYIDGILVKSFPYILPTYTDSYDRFVIGKMSYNYTSTSVYFPVYGVINDVRIYDNVLSVKEISELAKGLCLQFPMNQMDKPMCNLVDVDTARGSVNTAAASLAKTKYIDDFTGQNIYRQIITITDSSKSYWHYCAFEIYRSYFKKQTKYYFQAWVRANYAFTCNAYLMASTGTQCSLTWPSTPIKAYEWTKISGIATTNDIEINDTNAQVLYISGMSTTTSGFAFEIKHPVIVESDVPVDITFCPDHGSNLWYTPSGTIEYDTSGFGNNANSVEASVPYCAYGEMGACYDFKSELRYLKGINPLQYNLPFSIVFWMYYDTSLTVYGSPCVLTSRTEVGSGLAIFVTDTYIRFDDNTQTTFNTSAHLNKWTHVVLVHGSSKKYAYVNGKSIGSAAVGNMANTAATLAIGNSFQNASTAYDGGNYFRGKLKDLRIYNTELSAEQVESMYKARQYVTDHSVLLSGEIIN